MLNRYIKESSNDTEDDASSCNSEDISCTIVSHFSDETSEPEDGQEKGMQITTTVDDLNN